ncbi:MAG: hypothetical protein PHP51_03255 [Desulfotomaculaceae bacterium]|nr:hypothetical protein [Desulfotomaculaceae bacterium]MDD4765987.1 hypothetical protein [Desulfotomaculaceae bacterium]
MGNQESFIKDVNLVFNYQSNGTKYYLLTGGTGYPLAEFGCHLLPGSGSTGAVLVVPEMRQKTANITSDK